MTTNERGRKISEKLKANPKVMERAKALGEAGRKLPLKENPELCTVPECNNLAIQFVSKTNRGRQCYSCKELQLKYGITTPERNKLKESQHHKCGICNEPLTEKPHVDHCHTTGKIRGILCQNCNIGLGSFKDNIKALNNAINYLTK